MEREKADLSNYDLPLESRIFHPNQGLKTSSVVPGKCVGVDFDPLTPIVHRLF